MKSRVRSEETRSTLRFLKNSDHEHSAALFDIALMRAGLSAQEVWYCGDSFKNDVFGAHGAGIFPVLYDRAGACEETPATLGFEFLRVSDRRALIGALKGQNG